MAHKKTIFSIHGIRTRGEWQKRLNDILSGKYKTHTFDYGFFAATKLLIKPFRENAIDWFYDEYSSAINENDSNVVITDFKKRPTIIAHSFGSYIVIMSMLKYEEIKFDKIILCGSILPCDFDWSEIFRRDQVSLVRNEFGKKDFWANVVGFFVSDAGRSGRNGFDYYSNIIEQQQFSYFKHSDYFSKEHIKSYWLKTIEKKNIKP
jgi:serine/threonine-protein kinase